MLIDLTEQGKEPFMANYNSLDIKILCDGVYEMNEGVL